MRPLHLVHTAIRRTLTLARQATDCLTYSARHGMVLSIRCEHCGTWVSPRRYEPTTYACNRCAPMIAHAYYLNRRIERLLADLHQLDSELDSRNQLIVDANLRKAATIGR